MAQENHSEQERRRFVRLDLSENVRALDSQDQDIGRVERVGAGGLQIRLTDQSGDDKYKPGTRMQVCIVEPGNVRNQFKVEVRVCDGSLLGLEFLS
jgi:hypothetical protein